MYPPPPIRLPVTEYEDGLLAPATHAVCGSEFSRVQPETATRVVQEVRAALEQTPEAAATAALYGIEVTMARRWLRTLDRHAAPTLLQDGLAQHGLTRATADDLANELLDDCRRQDARQSLRLSRLGLQGMVAGGLFTLFFASVAVNGFWGPGVKSMAASEARWNAITAVITLALTAYSALLWHRHRAAQR